MLESKGFSCIMLADLAAAAAGDDALVVAVVALTSAFRFCVEWVKRF